METLAYILVLGIDLTPDGNVKLIAQAGLPSVEPGGGGEGPKINTLTAQGRDMTEAVDNLIIQSSKRPELNHLRLVVLSEKLARAGLGSVIDYLRRNVNIRLNIGVAVSNADLEKLLSVETPLSSQPAMAIDNQYEMNLRRSAVVRSDLKTLVSQILEPDREAILPILELSEDIFTMGKTAVFKNYIMVDTLDRHETFGLLVWQNQVNLGVFTTPQVKKEKIISYRIISSKTAVKTRWDGKKLHVQAFVDADVDIREIHGEIQVDLEKLASSYFIQRMQDSLAVAKARETDFLGLAIRLRRQDPEVWSTVQAKWGDVLKEAEYDLRCKVNIRGQGRIR